MLPRNTFFTFVQKFNIIDEEVSNFKKKLLYCLLSIIIQTTTINILKFGLLDNIEESPSFSKICLLNNFLIIRSR